LTKYYVSPRTSSPTSTLRETSNVIFRDGTFTVQDRMGAITTSTTSSGCTPQGKTLALGPSVMQDGGARLIAALDPCVLTDGSVVLNLPDDKGIQLIAANLQGNQATQSVILPMQRVAPITQGQTLYNVDLNEQVTGPDPGSGNQVTLSGNINALLLWNNAGKDVEFNPDNSVALNAIVG